MDVFETFASLNLDTSNYDEGLNKASSDGSSFAINFDKLMGVAAASVAAATAAVAALSAAFISGISDVAAYGDTIDKTSQKLGISSDAYQEWDFILQHAGTDIGTLRAGMRTLTKQAEENNEAFQKLGITQQDVASMSQEELFSATITALQNVESESERTALASELLGRSYMELNPLLNMSAEETEAMRQSLHEMGGVMSEEAVQNSAAFEDSLLNMKTAFSGIKNTMLSEFLPSLSTAMDGMTLILSGNTEEGLEIIREGVSQFTTQLTDSIPLVLEIGGEILGAIGTAIEQNLPSIISTGADVINSLVDGIMKFLPTLIQSAFMIIQKVGEGLVEAIPSLIPMAVQIIKFLSTEFLTAKNISMVIQSGMELLLAVADGLVDAMPELVELIPTIIANVVVAISENFPLVLETIGKLIGAMGTMILELITGLNGGSVQTFIDGWNNIKNVVSNKVGEVVNAIGSKFSGAFEKIASVLGKIKEKFTSIFDGVKSIVTGAIDKIKSIFNFSWKLPELKLPHISVKGGVAPYGIAGQGSLPKFDIKWYKKAYDDAYIMNGPTIFGAQGGKLLAGGEGNGSETIVGTELLMNMVGTVVRNELEGLTLPVYLDGDKMVGYIAPRLDTELGRLTNMSLKGAY